MANNIGISSTISWQDLYDFEYLINDSIGVKDRFIFLSKYSKNIGL